MAGLAFCPRPGAPAGRWWWFPSKTFEEGRPVLQRVVATLAPLIRLSAAWALDDKQDKARPDPPEKSQSVAEQVRDLQQEVQKARNEIVEKYRKAEKDEEKQELLEQYSGVGRTFAGRFLELAQKNAADPGALQALVFLVSEADGTPEAATAAELIVKDHLNDRQVLALVPRLVRSPAPVAEKIIQIGRASCRGT